MGMLKVFWALFILDVEVDKVMEKSGNQIRLYPHTMPTEKVLESLNTTKAGLTESEATARLRSMGRMSCRKTVVKPC